MRIGAVAEKLGLTPSAIRYYERQGLIRRVGRVGAAREFDADTILTLRFLKLAQSAGFTLREVRRLLEYGFGETRPQADWQDFFEAKKRDIRHQIADLNAMSGLLDQFSDCACESLEDCMSRSDCLDAPSRRPVP